MTDFKSVKSLGEFWDPRKNPDGTNKAAATSTDAIECYYLGCEYDQGKDNNSTLHKILYLGTPPHGGAEAWMEKNVWGSHVLDDQLSKIAAGMLVRIQWLGMKQPKKETGREYHDWEVFQATDDAALDAAQLQTMRADAAKAASAAQAQAAPAAPAPAPVAPEAPVAAPAVQPPAAPAPAAIPVVPVAAPVAPVPAAPAPAAAPVAPPVAAPVAPAPAAQPVVVPPPVDPAAGEGTDDLPF